MVNTFQNVQPPPTQDLDTGPGPLQSAWQYRVGIIIGTLLSLLVAFAASFLQPTMYQSSARLLLADPRTSGVFDDPGRNFLDPSRYARNQAELVGSTQVAARAVELLQGSVSTEVIRERTTARPSADLDVITIDALDPTAEGAAALADALGQAYQEVVAARVQETAQDSIAQLEESKQTLQARIDLAEAGLRSNADDVALQAERNGAAAELVTVRNRADQIAVDAALYGGGVSLFERAEVSTSPAQPQPIRNASLGAVIGLMTALGLAWWRAGTTESAMGRQDPAAVLRAPLLGEVPDYAASGVAAPVPTLSARHSVPAEAYQFIVASLDLALAGTGGNVVLITSASPGDGKTLTALNMTIAATDGRRCILIDADQRARGLTTVCSMSPTPGLTDLADENLSLESCVHQLHLLGDDRLPVIPAGTHVADPAGFFRTPAFRKSMVRIKEGNDFIVIDSPPLLAVADTSALASQVDGIVMVVRKGTRLSQLREIRERLDFIGTPVLGYVFNRSVPRAAYAYGYGYGQTEDPANKDGRWSLASRKARKATRKSDKAAAKASKASAKTDKAAAKASKASAKTKNKKGSKIPVAVDEDPPSR